VPAFAAFDANGLASSTVRLLGVDLRRRRLRIDVVPLPGDATAHGDRAQIERVLVNLLLNAMDATASSAPPRRPIELRIARTGAGAIEYAVADGGPGLPEAHLARLFHSFHSTKAHGMGLGLSIARSIVEAHGGTIRGENNAGAGATFRVTLPNG
jgi:signal transduction histidine kinase